MYEDDPGWDCHTMGNQVCGESHYTSGDHDAHTLTERTDALLATRPTTYEWATMPDTSMQEVPSGLPLDGIGLIVVLFATLIFRRTRTR